MMNNSPFKNLKNINFLFNDLNVNGYRGGKGHPLIIVHGSGPGASSIGNWRTVLDELALNFDVLAIDLIGFGLSDKKTTLPYFDYELWISQIRAAIDYLNVSEVFLIGHSLAGSLVLKAAALDHRVKRVVTTGTMGTLMPSNAHLNYVWKCPKTKEEMRKAAESLIYDNSFITDEYLDFRMQVIGSQEYQSYFDQMFCENFNQYIEAASLTETEIKNIQIPILMLHGMNDLPIPAEYTSIPLAFSLPHADLILLKNCNHSIALEKTDKFLAAVNFHLKQ